MHKKGEKPQALFLFPDGSLISDDLVCSGIFPSRLEGKPCPFSEGGRMPRPQPMNEVGLGDQTELDRSGEFAPPCAVEHLGTLATWQNAGEVCYPKALDSLNVYKCRQMFLLVVLGLGEDQPQEKGAGS